MNTKRKNTININTNSIDYYKMGNIDAKNHKLEQKECCSWRSRRRGEESTTTESPGEAGAGARAQVGGHGGEA